MQLSRIHENSAPYAAAAAYSLEPCHANRGVHGIQFSPGKGELLCSVGFDGSCFMWEFNESEYMSSQPSSDSVFTNLGKVQLSKFPLLQCAFLTKDMVAIACADSRSYIVDSCEYTVKSQLKGHESYVNGIAAMDQHQVITSSDDCTCRLWDIREAGAIAMVDIGREATSVGFSPAQPTQIFVGSLDNTIRCFDPRKFESESPLFVLRTHRDTVTGLSLTADGRELLSSALDGTIAIWDSAPFTARPDRLIHKLVHGLAAQDSISDRSLLRCAWSPDNRRFSAGSGSGSDYAVCIWDRKGQPLKALPGHSGFVIEVAFHPTQNLIASCGMDGKLLVGAHL